MSIARLLRPLAFVLTILSGGTMAAAPQVAGEADDPPRRVGRISYMDGTVSFRNGETDQWVPATLNYPVTSGDGFWAEPKSRAEIQIGSAMLRFDQVTAIHFLRLDDSATVIQIDQGSINLRLREVAPGGIRLTTPHGNVVINEIGRYHVDVAISQDGKPSNHTRVAVFEGAALIEGLASPLIVSAGHSATLGTGQALPLLAQAIALPLDDWALERDGFLTPKQTTQYVPPEMTGTHELDHYGDWVSEPTYGAIWYPRNMAADWAPYRYGHWAYIRPWGWTWIDHQPWGFAPFHYGRWVRHHHRWGWHPGHRAHRPIYAPALVIFANGGSNVILASGRRSPAMGWAPLGLHESYRPHHRHSPRYAQDINLAHMATASADPSITGRRSDREFARELRHRDGLTVVAAESFTGAVAVDKARVTLRDNDWSNARPIPSLDHLSPSRSARAGVVVPAEGSINRTGATASPSRQALRRGERRDDYIAPTTITRPALTSAIVPTRHPDVLPQAPGPLGNRPKPHDASPVARQDPALAPSNRATVIPGRSAIAPVAPTESRSVPGVNIREGRDSPRERRQPAGVPMTVPAEAPRMIAPTPRPAPITPNLSPGNAPHTSAPSRPAAIQPAPTIQPSRRDDYRLENRSNNDRRREQPRAVTPSSPPRIMTPTQNSTPSIQSAPRPQYSAPPQRQFTPQNTERRSAPSTQSAPSRPTHNDSGSRRQETPAQNPRKRPQDGTGIRTY